VNVLSRQRLLHCYRSALEAVAGERCVADALGRLRLAGPLWLVAVGKAGPAMARGALAALGEGIVAGLVITKRGHCESLPWPCLEGGHPLPDAGSLAAGEHLLAFLRQAPGDARFLFLVSGGASAVLEALPEPLELESLVRVNDWLLGSGLDIHAMNRVRKSLSLIKGGRLVTRLRGRRAWQLLISDVAGDDPAVIGSGPLVADRAGAPDPDDLPPWLRPWVGLAPAGPAPGDPAWASVETVLAARLDDALDAAERTARELGLAVHRHREFIAGDAATAGRRLARALCAGPSGLHLWGGETTVRLPAEPGRGGRCQQLALAAAGELAGRKDVSFLAAGTDGSDGPGEDAGALVDGDSVARGRLEGLDIDDCLARADAGSFLEASGDLVQTGPTGTNVMDLMLGLKE